MTTQTTNTLAFVRHLRSAAEPFRARRRAPKAQAGRQPIAAGPTHDAAYRRDPELYALAALADRARPEQRARVLFQLLAQSRAGVAAASRPTLDRVAARLAAALPADDVVAVFLALRRSRANHKHVRRAVVRYLLNHPRLAALARRRRPAVVDCLEHALGRDVARGCAKVLAAPGAGPVELAYVRRNLLRFADTPDAAARAGAVVKFLYGQGDLLSADGEAADARDGDALAPLDRAPPADRPRTVTSTNRGDISATLVHLYRGGDSPDLRAALDRYVAEAAAGLPRFGGSVAVVLDASASTRGYGEREFAGVAQSQALRLVLARCCAGLRVATVGGGTPGTPEAGPPIPGGNTDLAGAVLDALEGEPDVVAIVSDGYENVAEGDLARVLASLSAAGVRTPVVFCHSLFTPKDDLSLRRPTAGVSGVAEVEFWHQDDFADVLWTVFASAADGKGEAFVRAALRRRLEG